ncbi:MULTISPECIES: hypothetical protein [unclassified Peribacillus]|nr:MULTISPECIES: hypothetical protein [unclassified Peribacillus]WMX56759.1 hypothetical protein RE409_05925 [Peribacillus sp. R9-11]
MVKLFNKEKLQAVQRVLKRQESLSSIAYDLKKDDGDLRLWVKR